MQDCDYLIIGAGIAGASAGYFLAGAGSTVILEREDVAGYHTTGRSAAFYAETYGNVDIQRLTTASKDFFFTPPAGFTDVPLVKARGALYVAGPGEEELLAATLKDMQSRVPSVYEISAAQVMARVPGLRPEKVIGGLVDPDCQDIDVNALHQGYLRGMKRLGGQLITGAAVQSVRQDGDKWVLSTSVGDFRARVVINAAGAWGDELAKMAGVTPLGLSPKRRTIVICPITGDPLPSDMPLTLNIQETLYFKPEGRGLLVSPADETPSAPCDAQPEELDVALTVDRLQQATAYGVDRVERKWAGLRTFVADRTPVVGFATDHPGFFWCVGQGGYGIQTSPAMGQLVAGLVIKGQVPESLVAYGITAQALSPGRNSMS